MIARAKLRQVPTTWIVVVGTASVLAWFIWLAVTSGWSTVFDRLSNFTTVLLGIFIEASPFLLLGSLGSGIVEVVFHTGDIRRWIPRHPFLGAMTGALMGFFFPVCECGVVPFTRRLFQKGLPVPVGIAFLLSAPALNPIVIISTLVAFGWGPVFWGRMGLTFLIATLAGFIFSFHKNPIQLLNQTSLEFINLEDGSEPDNFTSENFKQKAHRVFTITVDEFFEIGRYLVIGASLAALLQTLVPQSGLLSISKGPVLSVLLMILMAVLLSVCSTVDAFIALSFAGSFTTGSILAFLVFGPMVDIKSTLMFLHVFRRRTVLYMILIPLSLVILLAVFINLNTGL